MSENPAMTSQSPSSVLLAMQEAALIHTSVSDHKELTRQELNIKKAQETTENTSAVEYNRKQHKGKFDSELTGRGQNENEQKCLGVLAAKALLKTADMGTWIKKM